MTNILDFFDSAQATALVAFFVLVIRIAYQVLRPLWEKKITTEKNNHTKQALETGLKFADAIVPELAVMESLSKTDRKKEAIRFVGNQLKANGLDIDVNAVSGLIEQAYQAYKVKGGDNHFPQVTGVPADAQEQPAEKSDLNA